MIRLEKLKSQCWNKIILLVCFSILISEIEVFGSLTAFCVKDPYSAKSCDKPNSSARIKSSTKKPTLNWDVLNLKNSQLQIVSTNSAIEITQSDVTQLAAPGNSWVVFGGSNEVLNMNIGTANSSSAQSWSLPSDFQNYFDYYTQDDFIGPLSVPAGLLISGATHVTRSVYVSDTDEEFEVYDHFNVNSSGVNHLGKSFDFDIDDDAFDEPDYEFMDVPLSLGDVMNNTIDEYDYQTDQILYRNITTLTVDAYGTITIPGYGTYNCLRGNYQSQYFKRPNDTSPFVLESTSNSIGFMTKQGHFFQAKIASQTGQNAVLENMSFKAIVPTALLNAPSSVKLNNDNSGISINTSDAAPHPSAILDIDSDSLGILIPRIAQANRPTAPAEGLLIYQVDNTPGFYFYDGTDWKMLSTSSPLASIESRNARKAASNATLNIGIGQLVKGKAYTKFDHPLENFDDLIINIQLEGDCNGVYISKKTREGFEVKELKKGKSNVTFRWSLN